MRHIISAVEEGSLAHEKGLAAGDELISVNGKKVQDAIDYHYLTSAKKTRLVFKKASGQAIKISTDDFKALELGIEYENGLMDRQKNCRNRCIFCFIDQLPKGMRKPLYEKDDDWRLSVLLGNFVTLTNITPADIQRICRYKVSPLYISVHSTDPDIRKGMMGNVSTADILQLLQKLAKCRISFHSQIVLVPGVNDRENLERTLRDLYKLSPFAASAAVVPVGLTRYREGLHALRTFTKEEMRDTVALIHKLQAHFRDTGGSSFVFAADEMYLASGMPMPAYDDYEDFPQLQNGVGLWRKLEQEFKTALADADTCPPGRTVSMCTGQIIAPSLRELVEPLVASTGMKVNICPIRNEYFGEGVTVTGLITGEDIYNQLRGKTLGEELLIPLSMLKSGEAVFLDDMRVDELARKLNIRITPVAVEGHALLQALLGKTEA